MIEKEDARNILVLLSRLTNVQFNEVETVAALKAKLTAIVNAVEVPNDP